jgi:hypothetical protein
MNKIRENLEQANHLIFEAEQLLHWKPNKQLLYRIRCEIGTAINLLTSPDSCELEKED